MKRSVILLVLMLMANLLYSQEWCIKLPFDDCDAFFFHCDASADYNYSLGSVTEVHDNKSKPLILCVNNEGEYKYRILDFDTVVVTINAALGLGDGNLFVNAYCNEPESESLKNKLWLAIINPNLEILHQNLIDVDDDYMSFGPEADLVMNEKAEIILATQITKDNYLINPIYDYAFYKFDNQCNMIKNVILENTSYNLNINDLTIIPESECYAIFGKGMYPSGTPTVFYLDDNLNYMYSTLIDDPNNYPNYISPEFMDVHWLDNDSYLMSAMTPYTHGYNEWYPLLLKMDKEMNIIDSVRFERVDTTDYVSQHRSLIYHNSNTIYVSTFWQHIKMHNMYPNTSSVFLLDENLDVLGEVFFDYDKYIALTSIQHTADDGCIVVGTYNENNRMCAIMWKLSREDFLDGTNIKEEIISVNTKIFPNPVSDNLNIYIDKINDIKVCIDIFDVKGRIVLENDTFMSNNEMSIDVSSLKSGMYFCRIKTEEKYVFTDTFIKE